MQLTKIFGEGETRVTALNSISVRFTRGTFTAIMGPSGSGKSTLMHCLAGLDRITSGQVFLAGMEISNLPDAKLTTLRRDNVGSSFSRSTCCRCSPLRKTSCFLWTWPDASLTGRCGTS
ncbi:ABC transporter ATP-binding protein [Cutibacterium acnes JCM 18909]|nr:ABC transporter ATP-binding protein [Cutibacterium acnes JCM 18909]